MASDEEDGDIKLLADLTRTRVFNHEQLQIELEMAALSLQRQKKIATVLVKKWNHYKEEDAFTLASAAEQLRITAQCIREAEVTKERILRMGTRYLIMDSWHEYMTQYGESSGFGRQNWLKRERDYPFGPEAILELMTNQRDVLNIEIKEMTAMLQRQEKEMREKHELTSFQVQRIVRKEIESLQNQIESMAELDRRKKKEVANEPPQDDVQREAPPSGDKTDESEGEAQVVDEENDDEAHWKRMVREVTEKTSFESSGQAEMSAELSQENPTMSAESSYEHPAVSADSSHENPTDEEPTPKKRADWHTAITNRMSFLEEKRNRMQHDLSRYPYRDRGDRSLGIAPWTRCAFCEEEGDHFSDACPRVRDGDSRYDIVNQKGRCIHCLEGPRGHHCRYRTRECWYCFRLSSTVFADLRPGDGGLHHRALCNVPNKKHIAAALVEQVESEIYILKRDESMVRW
ncbi:hypothetical protein COOONC_04950 [Cooperia oncophora]